MQNMKLRNNRVVVILGLVIVLSQSSQEINHIFEVITLKENGHSHCSNGSICPTWFVCNLQNSCQCGDGHNHAVVCDIENKESAILDCYCATYDRYREATHLGLCFYNCLNINPKRKMDNVYKELPQKPKELLNKINRPALTFTGQVYCVAIVKRDTVRLYSHIISVV
jgi:hypothetical protein